MDDSSDSGSGSDSGVSGCPNGYECRSRNFIENDDNISTINNGDDDDDDDDHDQQPQNSIMTLSNKKHLRFNNNHDYNQHNHNNNNNTDATNLKSLFFCYRTDPEYDGEKPLPLILPRYKLTAVAHETFTRVYGLALLQERSSGNIATSSNSDNNENYMRLAVSNKNSSNSSDNDDDDDNDDAHVNNDTVVNVAYFSSMGSLDSNHVPDLQRHQRVTTVLIVVHGSGRTAEDYLYGAMSSLPTTAATATKTQTDQQDSIMVLSPWFLDRDDDTMVSNNNSNNNNNNSSSSSSSSSNDTIPIPLPPNTLRWYENGPTLYHTWRYGANAIDSSFSSFAVMDALVERLMDDSVRFPSLQRIVITGHSAGGQYVQRWALLSNSPAWRRKAQASTAATATADATADAAARNKYESPISMEDRRILLDKRPFSNRRNIEIRAIPANPRCFAMLDDRRYIRDVTTKNITVFRRPDSDVIAACPDFNEWIWGLQAGGNVTVPYKDRAVADAGGVEALARRYVAERQLIYLAGGADTQIFEDECGSVLQGQTRRERSERYMASLHELYPKEMKTHCRHTRLVAEGIPHDHTLMFQSPAGQKALFGENGCS